jgi:hypothetical protein
MAGSLLLPPVLQHVLAGFVPDEYLDGLGAETTIIATEVGTA